MDRIECGFVGRDKRIVGIEVPFLESLLKLAPFTTTKYNHSLEINSGEIELRFFFLKQDSSIYQKTKTTKITDDLRSSSIFISEFSE